MMQVRRWCGIGWRPETEIGRGGRENVFLKGIAMEESRS